MHVVRFVLLMGALFSPAACRSSRASADVVAKSGPDGRVRLTMDVAPTRVACRGLVPMQCLQVRIPPDTSWLRFYDPIEGFEYQEGYWWTLDVERRPVPHPPADGSSFAYRLVRVISRKRG